MRYHRRYCLSNPKAAENKLKRRAPPKRKGPYICNVCEKPYDNDKQACESVAGGALLLGSCCCWVVFEIFEDENFIL
ncbi:hypothetical protein PF007_g1203 [Phytophthora fragariae]|nr:hypothetical protein PF007_g1203 [Phytophthora fragariae]